MTGRGVKHNGYIETGRIRQAYGENGDSRHNAIIYNQYLMYINFFKLKKNSVNKYLLKRTGVLLNLIPNNVSSISITMT